jgi:hypothetical protein
MRVLVIGYPLPDGAIDNYSVLTAPSYSDYDALFIDPASITRDAKRLIDEGVEFEAHDGRPVVNAPTTASAVSAADQIRRRAEETRRLLESGGSVIVMAKPNAVQAGVVGFEGCDRYAWLPAPSGLSWATPYLRAAEGKTTRVVAEDHPLSSLLREFRNEIGYRATLDDRQPELRAAGRVLAHGGSGIPIAMEFPLLGGRVLLIPAFSDSLGPIRGQIATGVVNLCRLLGGAATGEESPYWARSLALPGLEQAEAELETATLAASETQARVDAARERHDSLVNHRRLLWDTGRPFEQAVVEALRMAGFGVTGGFGEPLELTSEGTTALLEIESGFSEVVEWPYVRLQRRLEERLLKTSEQLKGVVIVNGQRQTAPDARGEQFTAQLRIACENYQYALVTAETIFGLVLRILAGADESALIGARRRILGGVGLVSSETVLDGTPEGKDAGPIF